MTGDVTHYQRLRITPDASADEVRAAYRRMAREFHPDNAGEASAERMAEINEAWRVLSDPARRAMYDAGLRGVTVTPRRAPTGRLDEELYPVEQRPRHDPAVGPPPFPTKRLAIAVGIAMVAGFVISGLARKQPDDAPKVDPITHVGDCVTLLANGDAKKVACDSDGARKVEAMVAFDADCPTGLEPHRDSQGLGIDCLQPE